MSVDTERVLRAVEGVTTEGRPEANPARLERARAAALTQFARIPPLASQIADRFSPGDPGSVLELGCGVGPLTLELAARGRSVTAIDPIAENLIVAEVAARAAGLQERITFICGGLDPPRYAPSVDAVVSNRALLFVAFEDAVSAMMEVLEPGGRAVLALHGAGQFLKQAAEALEKGDLAAAGARLDYLLASVGSTGAERAQTRRPHLLEPDDVVAIFAKWGFTASAEAAYGAFGLPLYTLVSAEMSSKPAAPPRDAPPTTDVCASLTPRITQLRALARAGDLHRAWIAWADLLRVLSRGEHADRPACIAAIARLSNVSHVAPTAAEAVQPVVSVRPFPYPYRAMLTLANDIDRMGLERFRQVHRFLNTLEETEYGPGLGLDVADSLWFYPGSALEGASETLAYFVSKERAAATPHGEELLEYVRRGWIDSLHAYGDWSLITERASQFTRAHAEAALAVLARNDLTIPVWINHGDHCNIQNVGRHTYMEGDLPDSQAYHWDLTLASGVKFVWTGGGAFDYGRRSALSPAHWRDGSKTWMFSRFHYSTYDDAALDGLLPSSADQMRRHRTYAVLWHPVNLHVQLSERRLCRLIDAGEFAVIAQHLGATRGLTKMGAPAVSALRRLKRHHEEGEILVARTERLLHYNLARDHVRYTVQRTGRRLLIDVAGVDDPVHGFSVPRVDSLRGLTFYVPVASAVELRLGGVPVPDRLTVRNPSDGIAPSVGIRWFDPDYCDHSLDFATASRASSGIRPPGGGATHDPVRRLERLQEEAVDEPSTEKRRYAVQYAIGCYAVGLENYETRLRSAGFEHMAEGLDIGAGPGQWSLAFLAANGSIVGIDARAEFVAIAADIARELGLSDRARFQIGRAEQLPFEAHTFDGVICHGVLMYLDAEIAFAEVGRVLKPNGSFYCGYSSFGFRLNVLRAAIASRDMAKFRVQLAHVIGDRLYRAGLDQTGFSRVRSPDLDQVLTIADLSGLLYVDEPGVQDGQPTFLGYPGTVDFVARKGEVREYWDRLLALGAGNELLDELEKLLDAGCPNAVVELLGAAYGDVREAEVAVRRLSLRALIKAGREKDLLTAELDATVDQAGIRGLLRHQSRRHAEALAFYEQLPDGEQAKEFLVGTALLLLGRDQEAESVLARGGQSRDNWECRLAMLEVHRRRQDGDALLADFGELLLELGAETGARDDAEALVLELGSNW